MLGAMTLALTAAAVPSFNGLFYATAATVIPVLFLAIAVQGSRYQDLTGPMVRAVERGRNSRTWYERLAFSALAGGNLGAAFLTLVYGVAGEIAAILALISQQASGIELALAAGAPILLTLVVAVGPAVHYLKTAATILSPAAGDPASSQQKVQAADDDREPQQEPRAAPRRPGTASIEPDQAGESPENSPAKTGTT
jgi:hypothetical protein